MDFPRLLRVSACVLLGSLVHASDELGRRAEQTELHQPALASGDQIPDGLTAADWADIRAAHAAARAAQRHALLAVDGGHRARNPGQRWVTSFDGRGFTVEPDAGGWSWGLELVRFGFEGHERTVGDEACASAAGQHLDYAWDPTLSEWYVNDTRGLEHGYTVHERPTRDAESMRSESSPLSFTLAVRGELCAEVQEDGRGVRFVNDDGAAVLTYAGLTVLDADGQSLPARLERVREGLRLCVDERGARYPLTVDPIAQQAYLKASNTGGADQFGGSVSVSGDTVVVGAYVEDSNATGVNGNQSNNSSTDAGAAYVFVRSGASWSQQAYLKASNTGAGDQFGTSVSVSGDTVVVGAHYEDSNATGINGNQSDNSWLDAGAAYVFVRSGTSWSQQAYLKASSNTEIFYLFGSSVSVSGDTVLVGALAESSNATGVNGDPNNNLAGGSGAAYVFVRSGTSWSQQAYLKASNTGAGDQFGGSVSVSGDTAVVGALAEASNATGVNGDQSDNSASESGAAYVFVRSGTSWSQQAYLKASNTEAGDVFGDSVSLSGDTVVIGAANEASNATGVDGNQSDNSVLGAGAAYVFVRSGTSWSQQAYLKASNTESLDFFALSLSVSGDTVVAGAYEDSNATGVGGDQTNNAAGDSGAVYVFVRKGTSWSQQAYLKASNTASGDLFGFSASVSGDTVVVGALGEASNATGVNGDQSNNGAGAAGAAYVFVVPPGTSFCDASDGSHASCPCSNPGNPDAGCDNAQSTGGVKVNVVSQTTSPNAATLSGTGYSTMGAPTAIVIRSSSLDPSSPIVFGDGLRCINSSPLVRLAAAVAAGGTSIHTFGHSGAAGPGTFYYQIWYRNTPASFCTSDAFNLSNGEQLVW